MERFFSLAGCRRRPAACAGINSIAHLAGFWRAPMIAGRPSDATRAPRAPGLSWSQPFETARPCLITLFLAGVHKPTRSGRPRRWAPEWPSAVALFGRAPMRSGSRTPSSPCSGPGTLRRLQQVCPQHRHGSLRPFGSVEALPAAECRCGCVQAPEETRLAFPLARPSGTARSRGPQPAPLQQSHRRAGSRRPQGADRPPSVQDNAERSRTYRERTLPVSSAPVAPDHTSSQSSRRNAVAEPHKQRVERPRGHRPDPVQITPSASTRISDRLTSSGPPYPPSRQTPKEKKWRNIVTASRPPGSSALAGPRAPRRRPLLPAPAAAAQTPATRP